MLLVIVVYKRICKVILKKKKKLQLFDKCQSALYWRWLGLRQVRRKYRLVLSHVSWVSYLSENSFDIRFYFSCLSLFFSFAVRLHSCLEMLTFHLDPWLAYLSTISLQNSGKDCLVFKLVRLLFLLQSWHLLLNYVTHQILYCQA